MLWPSACASPFPFHASRVERWLGAWSLPLKAGCDLFCSLRSWLSPVRDASHPPSLTHQSPRDSRRRANLARSLAMAAQDLPAAPGLHEPEAPSSQALKVDHEMAATSHRAGGHKDHFEASRTTLVEDGKLADEKPVADKPVERSATQMSQDQYLPPGRMAVVLLGAPDRCAAALTLEGMLTFVFLVSLECVARHPGQAHLPQPDDPRASSPRFAPSDLRRARPRRASPTSSSRRLTSDGTRAPTWSVLPHRTSDSPDDLDCPAGALESLIAHAYSRSPCTAECTAASRSSVRRSSAARADAKGTYLSSLVFFEIGSLLCGVATSSKMVRLTRPDRPLMLAVHRRSCYCWTGRRRRCVVAALRR